MVESAPEGQSRQPKKRGDMDITRRAPFVSGLPEDDRRVRRREETLQDVLARFQRAVDQRSNQRREISDRIVGGYKEVDANKREIDKEAA